MGISKSTPIIKAARTIVHRFANEATTQADMLRIYGLDLAKAHLSRNLTVCNSVLQAQEQISETAAFLDELDGFPLSLQGELEEYDNSMAAKKR